MSNKRNIRVPDLTTYDAILANCIKKGSPAQGLTQQSFHKTSTISYPSPKVLTTQTVHHQPQSSVHVIKKVMPAT